MTDAAAQTIPAPLSADLSLIQRIIPHRYPFLLVDKVRDIHLNKSCVGIKNVTFNEPQFQGHFPERPVFPGVLLIEGMAQTAGAICVHNSLKSGGPGRPSVVYFMTVDKVKFRKPVVPGDRVEYHMRKLKQRSNMWWFRGEAKVDGKIVAEGEVSAMLVKD